MKAIDDLKALLCDQEGRVCIQGHQLDRSLIQTALTRVEKIADMNKSLEIDNQYLRGELNVARARLAGRCEAPSDRDADASAASE